MDTETMIRNLIGVEEKHKHDKVFTGQINTAELAHDVRKRLEELRSYEDTGLTSEQIMELKERDTAKQPRMIGGISLYATCLSCRQIICNFYRFCPECGQRLKQEEKGK